MMTREPHCFVGVDLGTSGCRAIAIDSSGQVLTERRAPLPPSTHPAAGASEQNPDDWWAAVSSTLSSLADALAQPVSAICVDGTSSTVALFDRAGEPCSPALMYNDTRARDEAVSIDRLAPLECAARGPGSALAKLIHLASLDVATDATFALHQADWIAGRLSGRFGFSDENNVLKLGYDPVQRRWPGWLSALALDTRLLPKVVPVGEPLGTVPATIARQLGLSTDCVVISGTTDSNAAALAAGIQQTGEAVTSLGSTVVLKILADNPVFDARYGVYSHRIGDMWLAGGASNTGGAVLRHFFDDGQLRVLSARLNPDKPLGLGYYPLLMPGERFPVSNPDLQPVLTPRPHSDAAFLQALLEGISDIEAAGYERLAELGAPYPTRVISSGGGAINEAWRQMREQRLGVPVLSATHSEAAYGTALLARRGFLRVNGTAAGC